MVTPKIALPAIALVPFIMALGNGIIIPMFPTMKHILRLTSVEVSLIMSVYSISASSVLLFVGYLSDRFGRKRVMIPSLIFCGMGGIISGLSADLPHPSYELILIGRMIQGIGAAGTTPLALALIGDLYHGPEQGKALGLLESSGSLAKVISPVLGSVIALITWKLVFFVFAILSFALSFFLLMTIEETQKENFISCAQYLERMSRTLKKDGRRLLPVFLLGSLNLCILYGSLFYLSFVLEKQYKIYGVSKGILIAAPLIGMVVAAYLTGLKIKQNMLFIRKGLLIGLFLLINSFTIISFYEQLFLSPVFLSCACIGIGIFLPCLSTLIIRISGESERGMIVALYECFRFLGVASGVPLFGWLLKRSHFILFLSVSGFCLLAFVFVLLNNQLTVVSLDTIQEEALE